MAAPMPLDAPVTIATLSESFIWSLFDVCRKSRNWYQIETWCKLRTVFQPSFLEVTAVMSSSETRVRDDRVLNDGRAALGNIRVIESDCPGFGHRLRMMGAATEHIRRGHNQGRLFAGSEKASVEVGQQRALATSGL